MPWTTKSTRTAYENPWIRVHEDEVVRPDGSDGIYGVMELRSPAVFVVALDEADRVLLVHLDRYTVGPSWEVVSGGSDGEDPETAARHELREEAGLEADEWIRAGRANFVNGVCVAWADVFVARGLRPVGGEGAHQAEEGIGAVRWVPFADALRMGATGEISDGETIAALAIAAAHLGRV